MRTTAKLNRKTMRTQTLENETLRSDLKTLRASLEALQGQAASVADVVSARDEALRRIGELETELALELQTLAKERAEHAAYVEQETVVQNVLAYERDLRLSTLTKWLLKALVGVSTKLRRLMTIVAQAVDQMKSVVQESSPNVPRFGAALWSDARMKQILLTRLRTVFIGKVMFPMSLRGRDAGARTANDIICVRGVALFPMPDHL